MNRRINKSVEAMTDMEHLHVPDRWDLAEDGIGDCEDFQLLKRHLLAEAGLSRRAMRMTVVIDEKGEGHAVLTLITDRGDLILDNKTNAILPWHRTGYIFIKRESQDAVTWVSLGGATFAGDHREPLTGRSVHGGSRYRFSAGRSERSTSRNRRPAGGEPRRRPRAGRRRGRTPSRPSLTSGRARNSARAARRGIPRSPAPP